MPLSLDEVRRIAWLARIDTNDAEAAALQAQLNDIFDLIGRMQKVSTEGVEPMTHADGLTLRLREDVVTGGDERELHQSVAPQHCFQQVRLRARPG